MATRYFFNITIFVFLVFQVQAQGNFSIKITQVYPSPGGLVYGNTYNLPGELEAAKENLLTQYSKKNANYVMEWTRSGKKDTRNIQNIVFVFTTDDVKYTSTKPKIPGPPSPPVRIKKFKCNVYGKPTGDPEIEDYCFHFEFFEKGGKSYSSGYYSTVEECEKAAKQYLNNQPKSENIGMVQWFKENTPLGTFPNEEKHDKFIADTNIKTEQTETNAKTHEQAATIAETQEQAESQEDNNVKKNSLFQTEIDKIQIKDEYDYTNIENNLKIILKITKNKKNVYLHDDSELQGKLDILKEHGKTIMERMKTAPKFKTIKNGFGNINFNSSQIQSINESFNKLKKLNQQLK